MIPSGEVNGLWSQGLMLVCGRRLHGWFCSSLVLSGKKPKMNKRWIPRALSERNGAQMPLSRHLWSCPIPSFHIQGSYGSGRESNPSKGSILAQPNLEQRSTNCFPCAFCPSTLGIRVWRSNTFDLLCRWKGSATSFQQADCPGPRVRACSAGWRVGGRGKGRVRRIAKKN